MGSSKSKEKPFIFWDGEATKDAGYCLFGASTGHQIKYPNLSTWDCLNLILQVESENPTAIHVGFAFGYDVNNIIKDLSFNALVLLYRLGHCRWRGFRIEYIPRKWFVVSRNGIRAKIFDSFLFFNSKFGIALRKYKIGTENDLQRIESGKEERPNFVWADIDSIEEYWKTELRYGVQLMDKLRSILYGADFYINSWHGPGALASYALGHNNVNLYMDRGIDPEIRLAAQYAMIGGRFQPFLAGYYEGPVYERDINSAYAYALSKLPRLDNGKWEHTYYPDRNESASVRLGLYRIRYNGKFSSRPMPLPHRESNGRICYPPATEGWFHAPEAAIVRNDNKADFLEAWIYRDDGTYPFDWIVDAFNERLILQSQENACEKTLKWMLAALFGQMAQRAGWERKGMPPKWHQLEWAGAITAECRAMIYTAARRAKESLVSIDTDGFISLAPVNVLPNGIGENLGQWKTSEHTGILYIQNGIYWLRDGDGNWTEPKSRGIPRKKLRFKEVWPTIRANRNLEISQHMFIGIGLALQQDITKWRTWVDVPRTIKFGGNGKAAHNSSGCPACRRALGWGEGLHPLYQLPARDIASSPHKLPWISEIVPTESEVLKEWGIFDEG